MLFTGTSYTDVVLTAFGTNVIKALVTVCVIPFVFPNGIYVKYKVFLSCATSVTGQVSSMTNEMHHSVPLHPLSPLFP